MTAYFIDVKHKGKWYMACFQVQPADDKPVFRIQYLELHKLEKDRELAWRTLLTLDFTPKMNAKSFAEKLPILLTFI
jgi:hypothetical protein